MSSRTISMLSTMEALMDEKDALLAERIKIMERALHEQKNKTKEAEAIAEEAIERAMKATKNWKMEKERRKFAENVLAEINKSTTTGIV